MNISVEYPEDIEPSTYSSNTPTSNNDFNQHDCAVSNTFIISNELVKKWNPDEQLKHDMIEMKVVTYAPKLFAYFQ
jgi:hypothetical protein